MAAGFFAMLLMVLGGGGGDLLDHLGTDSYWKAKSVADLSVAKLAAEIAPAPAAGDTAPLIKALGSSNFAEREQAAQKILAIGPGALPALKRATSHPDPEVANRVGSLIQQIQTGSKAAQVRRLMAIRTLGEMKKPEALPALKPLLDSREPFVADYAARAIGEIEGKPRPAGPDQVARDLDVLPANCGIVAQMRRGSGKTFTIEQMLTTMGPMVGGQDPKQQAEQAVAQIIAVADQIGNIRMDGLTLGVSEDVGPKGGFLVLVARGEYDSAAVEAFLTKNEEVASRTEDNTRVWTLKHDRDAGWFFPSDTHAVLLAGPVQEKLPFKEMIAAMSAGKAAKGLSANKETTQLMGTVDNRALLWAAIRVPESLRNEGEIFTAFDTLTICGRENQGAIDLEIKGAGTDAKKIAAAVDKINKGIEEARKSLPQMVAVIPAFKPIVDFMQSMKVDSTGNSARLTARMEGNSMLLVPLLFSARAAAAPMPPEPVPAPKVERVPEK